MNEWTIRDRQYIESLVKAINEASGRHYSVSGSTTEGQATLRAIAADEELWEILPDTLDGMPKPKVKSLLRGQ